MSNRNLTFAHVHVITKQRRIPFMGMVRIRLLLKPEQHHALAQLAWQEGRNISEIAREIIQEGIERRQLLPVTQREQRMQALQKARQVRQAILQERGGVPLDLNLSEKIADLREKRDDQILGRRD
jgi:hypothetical protein